MNPVTSNAVAGALAKTLLYKSGSYVIQGANTYREICKLNITKAGLYLIIGFVDCNDSHDTSYNNTIIYGGDSFTVRQNATDGGGCNNVVILNISDNSQVSLNVYDHISLTGLTFRGNIMAVKL